MALLLASLVAVAPARAADPPEFDCGKGIGVLFCPLKVPGFIVQGQVFVASEFMDHAERVAYPTLDGINFYGQLVGEMADRVVVTEGLIVDVAEDLLPGAVILKAVSHTVDTLTNNTSAPAPIRSSATQDILNETRPRAVRPAVIDYGKTVSEQSQKQ